MKLPRQLQDLKRQVINNIKAIVTPHMWTSGYLEDTEERTFMKVFSFAPLHPNSEHDTRSMGRVFNSELTVLQGFYSNGTIDALGGGCACVDFYGYCLEDLLAIEQWLCKNFNKEIERSNKHRKQREENQKRFRSGSSRS